MIGPTEYRLWWCACNKYNRTKGEEKKNEGKDRFVFFSSLPFFLFFFVFSLPRLLFYSFLSMIDKRLMEQKVIRLCSSHDYRSILHTYKHKERKECLYRIYVYFLLWIINKLIRQKTSFFILVLLYSSSMFQRTNNKKKNTCVYNWKNLGFSSNQQNVKKNGNILSLNIFSIYQVTDSYTHIMFFLKRPKEKRV